MANVGNVKKVNFAEKPTIYTIQDDAEYFRNYRKPYWELMAVDRHRFKRRIDFSCKFLNPILNKEYREMIYMKYYV